MRRMKLVSIVFVAAAFALPLAAAPRVDPVVVAARQRFFGPENVDGAGNLPKDKVIFSWLTNSSFAASITGRVVLLDTFVTRLEVSPGRVPFVIKDLVDLHPEAIFLGHGHFDHADNAAYLSKKTGAKIFASPETCDNMQLGAVKIFGADRRCRAPGDLARRPERLSAAARLRPDGRPLEEVDRTQFVAGGQLRSRRPKVYAHPPQGAAWS
jgi:glyoxylase-like metal-dependent hydrolase (beta-lactamase superfamily II)